MTRHSSSLGDPLASVADRVFCSPMCVTYNEAPHQYRQSKHNMLEVCYPFNSCTKLCKVDSNL